MPVTQKLKPKKTEAVKQKVRPAAPVAAKTAESAKKPATPGKSIAFSDLASNPGKVVTFIKRLIERNPDIEEEMFKDRSVATTDRLIKAMKERSATVSF